MISSLAAICRDVLGYKKFGIRKPLVLSISITSRCNLRCSYCYSASDNMSGRDIPTDELCGIIDAFHSIGTRIIMLQGGEPLLHKEVDRIITHVKSKGMYCAVTTNGMYVPEHLDSLKQVDQVQLSIDGNEEINDRNRGNGVYAALVRAMALCRDSRIPFHLHTVVTNESTRENTLLPLLELAKKYSTNLNFCFPNPTGAALGMHPASEEHLAAFYRMILDCKNKGMPINNTRRGIADIIGWMAMNRCHTYIPSGSANTASNPKCVMGDLVCWLDSEGMLHPCAVRFGQEGFSHSVKEYGVVEAWRKLANKPCHYCANSTEFNNLFNLRAEAVVNSLKFLSRKMFSRALKRVM